MSGFSPSLSCDLPTGSPSFSNLFSTVSWPDSARVPENFARAGLKSLPASLPLRAGASNLFGTKDGFRRREFSAGKLGRGDVLGMIQVHYIYCALYFYYDYLSSTSDHQA